MGGVLFGRGRPRQNKKTNIIKSINEKINRSGVVMRFDPVVAGVIRVVNTRITFEKLKLNFVSL
ncbi:hypothetical protein [Acidocella sp. KAb 2-4]|uniref:hypothetical protein n=1 Tax=Acidocella sp. KAb 2-4 TaxID=2885158 RepID=UPI001D06EC3D|nr:hypothetical protein [Acidocella sp. KAb 2-4]MCB5944386.1 hypothetical protein [Acidocella sp. KAb 2-4]